jgi:hypothetical protein
MASRPACAPLEHWRMFIGLELSEPFAISGERLQKKCIRRNRYLVTDYLILQITNFMPYDVIVCCGQ